MKSIYYIIYNIGHGVHFIIKRYRSKSTLYEIKIWYKKYTILYKNYLNVYNKYTISYKNV